MHRGNTHIFLAKRLTDDLHLQIHLEFLVLAEEVGSVFLFLIMYVVMNRWPIDCDAFPD